MTGRYPEHHEGITGADRDDWLLSLDEKAMTHRDCLIALARHLMAATLVGRPAPIVRTMTDRMRRPEPGDLVVETSRALRSGDPDDRVKGLGILLAVREEWADTEADWQQFCAEERARCGGDTEMADWLTDPDQNRCSDRAIYVQYGPAAGDICRWVNAEFVMVLPVQVDSFSLQVGRRDDSGVTLTRDDLVASLADSGFELILPDRPALPPPG